MKHFRQVVSAKTPGEAVALRKAIGPKSLYLAGGTTVVPMASRSVEVLVDISGLGLGGISATDEAVSIGATTPIAALLAPEVSSRVPLLYRAASRCATPIIRNMATVGGSLVGIYLPSDLAVALIALDAELDILGDGERTVTVGDLLDNGWLKAPDLVCNIRVGKQTDSQGTGYAKLGRSQIDVALVNAAAFVRLSEGRQIEGLRLSVGQSLSMPVLVKDVGAKAQGKIVSLDLIKELARLAADSVKPKSDFRASSWYRKHVVEALVARAIFDAAEEAGGRIEN